MRHSIMLFLIPVFALLSACGQSQQKKYTRQKAEVNELLARSKSVSRPYVDTTTRIDTMANSINVCTNAYHSFTRVEGLIVELHDDAYIGQDEKRRLRMKLRSSYLVFARILVKCVDTDVFRYRQRDDRFFWQTTDNAKIAVSITDF